MIMDFVLCNFNKALILVKQHVIVSIRQAIALYTRTASVEDLANVSVCTQDYANCLSEVIGGV